MPLATLPFYLSESGLAGAAHFVGTLLVTMMVVTSLVWLPVLAV